MKKEILYVEDDLSHSKLMVDVLATDHELEIVTATEGNLGVELAQRHHPDLILLDLRLIGMQGEDVLHQLKNDRRTRHIPVIVISADATARQAEQMLQLGAHAYLTKPFHVDELLDALRQVLGEQNRGGPA